MRICLLKNYTDYSFEIEAVMSRSERGRAKIVGLLD
jgi:hypothetical protein